MAKKTAKAHLITMEGVQAQKAAALLAEKAALLFGSRFQSELARQAGVTRRQVTRWLVSAPGPEHAVWRHLDNLLICRRTEINDHLAL